MSDTIRLVKPTQEKDEARDKRIRGALRTVEEMVEAGTIDGLVLVCLSKDGSNWTHISPIGDNVKMIGAVEMMKFDVLKTYFKAYGEL